MDEMDGTAFKEMKIDYLVPSFYFFFSSCCLCFRIYSINGRDPSLHINNAFLGTNKRKCTKYLQRKYKQRKLVTII